MGSTAHPERQAAYGLPFGLAAQYMARCPKHQNGGI
jgi:hypothetical protein